MKIQAVVALLSVVLLAACSTTSQTVTQRQTLEQRMMNKYATADLNSPAPPAEGPQDVPANYPNDVLQNPTLVPTPLLRETAIGGTP